MSISTAGHFKLAPGMSDVTPYHAKYYAYDLTRRASGGIQRISMSLFDATVDLNPHQIEAALFALHSPLSKGVILADEVGLGKTIEAGIVLCQYWAERKRHLLVLCPASIRKQWALELQEKFNLLKRSGKTQLPEEVTRPKHIGQVETLSVFGIDAQYMATFRDFLEEEGLPTNDDRCEVLLPVVNNLGTQKLKTIRLKKMINGVSTEFGDAFRKLGPVPTLAKPDPLKDEATTYLQKNQVVLNWYPKIQALKSGGVMGGDTDTVRNQTHLTAGHIAFLDVDRLYFELERFKAERGWYNLNVTRDAISPLLLDQTWYQLLIPPEELAFDSFERVRLWQDIALSLLKKYTERYYTFRKREWELPHLEYQDLVPTDPNFLGSKEEPEKGYYRILIERSQDEIAAKLGELKELIQKGGLKPWEFQGMKAVWFGRHLYEPLLYVDQKIVEISPVPLNKGERRFVEDLKYFHEKETNYFAGKELYLLRNLSKGRGVGFFEAGNFHPDFIVWLLTENRQNIVFVDPKGIRNIGATDPKIQFYETIKEIEQRMGDANVRLNSFIISGTPSHIVRMLWGMDKQAMKQRHVLFQEEDQDSYIGEMLRTVIPV